MAKVSGGAWKILQVTPADGWFARLRAPEDAQVQYLYMKLAGWALVTDPNSAFPFVTGLVAFFGHANVGFAVDHDHFVGYSYDADEKLPLEQQD